jgi:hypothetical protein
VAARGQAGAGDDFLKAFEHEERVAGFGRGDEGRCRCGGAAELRARRFPARRLCGGTESQCVRGDDGTGAPLAEGKKIGLFGR